jgi:hypothetical protein
MWEKKKILDTAGIQTSTPLSSSSYPASREHKVQKLNIPKNVAANALNI